DGVGDLIGDPPHQHAVALGEWERELALKRFLDFDAHGEFGGGASGGGEGGFAPGAAPSFGGGPAASGELGLGIAPPGLVIAGGGGGGRADFGGMTGITGCFSPGRRLMCPRPSFFSSSRTSSYLPSLVVSVASESRRILGRMNTSRFFF